MTAARTWRPRAWVVAQAAPLLEQGWTRKDAAARIGVTPNALSNALSRARADGEPVPAPATRIAPCGTKQAIARHRRHGEPLDPACAAVHRAPAPPARCGTDPGYRRHLRRGEPACDPCRAAHRAALRTWQVHQPVHAAPPPVPSGDTAWRRRAACAGADPALFECGDQRPSREHVAELVATARRWCAPCPVIADCAAEADRDHLSGLWGGSARTGAYRCSYVVRPLIPEAPGTTHIEEEA